MTTPQQWYEVYAEPGSTSIIDYIVPATGLSSVFGETEEALKARYPHAVRMTWDAFHTAARALQDTPITWLGTTKAQYHEMLNVLPPLGWDGTAFLVGEPTDHSVGTGAPRFAAYRARGGSIWDDTTTFETASRPLTVTEFKQEIRA